MAGICDRLGLQSTDDQTAKQKWEAKPVVRDRIEQKQVYERKAAAFRKAVWTRDGSLCRLCGRKVKRSVDSTVRGHVHHLKGRNVAPADKCNPAKAVLLCSLCHHDVHAGKATL